jgi:esterase/lipase superfamily enzyme
MGLKLFERWYSGRLQTDVSVVRWGHFGRPVIVFPTAGGDAEEIERNGLVDSVAWFLEQGRVKLYSCDSIAGAAMLRGDGSPRYRAALLNAFHDFVRSEMIPAIRVDCQSDDVTVVTTGASIGAFNALAMLCRYPDAVTQAVGLSGTYDLGRFIGGDGGEDLYFATPLHFLPGLGGAQLDVLRTRFAILATGEGRWENAGESWHLAHALGAKGIPNRVDPWGPQYDHDWATWRQMLPRYLGELA